MQNKLLDELNYYKLLSELKNRLIKDDTFDRNKEIISSEALSNNSLISLSNSINIRALK